ncbi:MAG TPA: hypothetical protein VEZ14_06355 [Dehalococcoidia bacterium]|nr:hypothetical protein [Dehalococcoidia bacterium]
MTADDPRRLPTPGQRVSAVALPDSYALPGKPDDAAPPSAHDAFRQTQFVLGNDLRLFAEGMALQLQVLHDSSHSRYRTHVYAAVIGSWSRAYQALADACLLVTRGSYASVPNLVRAACELIAAQHQVYAQEQDEFTAWMLAHLKPDDRHKAFDVGLGHYFAGSTLAADDLLRPVYRAASDLGRPNFGATLLAVGPESNNLRLAYAFADTAFHVGWAEIQLGWLLRLCERQLAVAAHMPDVLNVTPETHAAYADYRARVQSALDAPARARIDEAEDGGFKRWLVHNLRRQPSGAPKRYLL